MKKNSNRIIIKESTLPKQTAEGTVVDVKKVKNSNDNSRHAYLVQIEALHVMTTENSWMYSRESLESMIPSWTHPYRKPVILFHKDQDGKMIGKVVGARIKDKNTRSGTPALLLTVYVSDAQGVKDLEAGLLTTVSVGMQSDETYCTICGQNINKYGACGHKKGKTYDVEDEDTGETERKKCYYYAKALRAEEVSYVIIPSDKYAHNTDVKKIPFPEDGFQSFLDTKKVSEIFKQKEQVSLNDLEELICIKESEEKNMEKDKIKELLDQANKEISIKEGKEGTEPKPVTGEGTKEVEPKLEEPKKEEPKKEEDKDKESVAHWKKIASDAMNLLEETEELYKKEAETVIKLSQELIEKRQELSDTVKKGLQTQEAFVSTSGKLKEAIDYIAKENNITIKESDDIMFLEDVIVKIKESAPAKIDIEDPTLKEGEVDKDITIKESKDVKNKPVEKPIQVKEEVKEDFNSIIGKIIG